jgi:hypothetical protein
MELPLTEEERKIIKNALEAYLAGLRERIYKIEVYEANPTLRREELILLSILKRLQG